MSPGETIAAIERECILKCGVAEGDLDALYSGSPVPLPGERRPLRVPVTDFSVEGGVDEHGSFVRVAFELPRGCYATALLDEIMKPGDAPTVSWESRSEMGASADGDE